MIAGVAPTVTGSPAHGVAHSADGHRRGPRHPRAGSARALPNRSDHAAVSSTQGPLAQRSKRGWAASKGLGREDLWGRVLKIPQQGSHRRCNRAWIPRRRWSHTWTNLTPSRWKITAGPLKAQRRSTWATSLCWRGSLSPAVDWRCRAGRLGWARDHGATLPRRGCPRPVISKARREGSLRCGWSWVVRDPGAHGGREARPRHPVPLGQIL